MTQCTRSLVCRSNPHLCFRHQVDDEAVYGILRQSQSRSAWGQFQEAMAAVRAVVRAVVRVGGLPDCPP